MRTHSVSAYKNMIDRTYANQRNCCLYKYHAKASQIKVYAFRNTENKRNTDIKQRSGIHGAILYGKVISGVPWGCATLVMLNPLIRDQRVEVPGGIHEAARMLGSSEWLKVKSIGMNFRKPSPILMKQTICKIKQINI